MSRVRGRTTSQRSMSEGSGCGRVVSLATPDPRSYRPFMQVVGLHSSNEMLQIMVKLDLHRGVLACFVHGF